MPLAPGDDAPTFAAQNQHDERVVCQYDRPTVLFFYPRDDTPGCTTEATQFEAHREDFETAGIDLYGISTDSVESHREFADAQDLSFDILADPDANVASAFDVALTDGAAHRTTFVVVGGVVRAVYDGVHPDGHAENVLADLVQTGLVSVDS